MEREISIILRIKGAAQAKKAVQDVFSGQTKQAVEAVNVGLKKTGDRMQRVDKTSKRAGKSMDSFTKILGRSMAALYLYNRAWATFGRNFESGLQLQRASEQFDRHVGNVVKMLPELRSATRGIIADFDLLKTANRAFQQGIQPQRIGKTFRLATSAAQKLGLSATDAINTVTNAITKQDEGALNTLGIVTKVNQAYKIQAALIAKNGGVMSNALSIQLRQSLIMKELEKRFGGVNEAQEDGLMVLERFKASWKNFRATIGDTLGLALLPLTRALTGVLDLTTALLNRLNKTGGFEKFIQIAGTLAAIWGTSKFIRGAQTLMGLFGFMSGKDAVKIPKMLSKTAVLIGAFGRAVSNKIPILGKFGGWLTKILKLSPAFARLIPGWGTAIAAVTLLFDPFVAVLKKAWLAGRVFFQLLSEYNERTGLSRVLKRDAEDLGRMYNLIENIAKISLEAWAVLKGMGQGISEAYSPVGTVISWVTDQLSDFAGWLLDVDKMAVRSASRLDMVTEKVKVLTKYIGLAASVIALFIPGLQGVGIAGAALFGSQVVGDLSNKFGYQPSQVQEYTRTGYAVSSTPQIATIPQTSTQREAPTPRAMNMDYSEDLAEQVKRMNKILEKQTVIMETDSQKQDIRESQRSAIGSRLINR